MTVARMTTDIMLPAMTIGDTEGWGESGVECKTKQSEEFR